MKGVIIIDEKQYVYKNIASISVTQTEEQFAIHLQTTTNQSPVESNEEILNKLIDSVESTDEKSQQEILYKTNPADSKATLTSPVIAHSDTPKLMNTNVRVSVKQQDMQKNSDLNPLTITAPSREVEPSTVPMSNQPSKKGIIIPDKPNITSGQRFPLGDDAIEILSRTRVDLGVAFVKEERREGLKNLKKNITIKSESFAELTDASVRAALHTMVMQEQVKAHVYNRENFLFTETPIQLVIVNIINEQQGLGEFFYEELVSVYENPKTTTTSVIGNKGNK